MAHADYSFYTGVYHGDVLSAENAAKWLDRASDAVDHFTFDRLQTAFPTTEAHAVKVRKAVCAVADALCTIDAQRKAVSAQIASDGAYRGAVASVSSGRESISYAVNATAANAYAAAAANDAERARLLYGVASEYLANVPDAEGVNLLYAGGERHVR